MPEAARTMAGEEWDVYVVTEVREWIEQLDDTTQARAVQAIDALAEGGPGLGGRWSTRSQDGVIAAIA